VRALEIRRAEQLHSGLRAAAMRAAAERFLRFYQRKGRTHFREEEEVLLPACARHVRIDKEPAMVRMLAEHALIRARIEELARALAAGSGIEPLLVELGQRLHDHVRFEEEELFPRVEAILGEEGLAALAPQLSQLHGKSCDLEG